MSDCLDVVLKVIGCLVVITTVHRKFVDMGRLQYTSTPETTMELICEDSAEAWGPGTGGASSLSVTSIGGLGAKRRLYSASIAVS